MSSPPLFYQTGMVSAYDVWAARIESFMSVFIGGFQRCIDQPTIVWQRFPDLGRALRVTGGSELPYSFFFFSLVQVNINEASIGKLSLLPSIGPTRAARIVRYRHKRRFKRKVELARVRGIGLKTVRRLKPYLVVKGATTLKRLSSTAEP